METVTFIDDFIDDNDYIDYIDGNDYIDDIDYYICDIDDIDDYIDDIDDAQDRARRRIKSWRAFCQKRVQF